MKGTTRLLKTHRASWRRAAWYAQREILKRSSWPILVGPWRGEVGFESLYWIPFIDKLKESGIAPDRLIPIGRAGSAGWYGCPQGLELYALREPTDVRVANRRQAMERGYLKQEIIDRYDRAIVKDAAKAMGLRHYHVLHPAWMYHVLAPYWTGWTGLEWLLERLTWADLPVPAVPDGVTLPEPYVAVKFYARETFPYQDKSVRQVADSVVGTLADPANKLTVLLMDTPDFMDDHIDLPITVNAPNIRRMSEFLPSRPETNLAIQSTILARSLGFVGTYGGMAQLALRIGKPAVSFYSAFGGTSVLHKHLSDVISLRTGRPFQVYWTQEIALARTVLPHVIVHTAKKEPHLDTRPLVPVAP